MRSGGKGRYFLVSSWGEYSKEWHTLPPPQSASSCWYLMRCQAGVVPTECYLLQPDFKCKVMVHTDMIMCNFT